MTSNIKLSWYEANKGKVRKFKCLANKEQRKAQRIADCINTLVKLDIPVNEMTYKALFTKLLIINTNVKRLQNFHSERQYNWWYNTIDTVNFNAVFQYQLAESLEYLHRNKWLFCGGTFYNFNH